MRSRTFTQLHASLYMEECSTAKKEKGSFNLGKDAKTKTKRMSKAVVAGTIKKKKQNSYSNQQVLQTL